MLRKIAILCALCALPAAGQDGLLGTWEYSTDSVESFGIYWEHFDTLEELTIENGTRYYVTSPGQLTRHLTIREDGTFHFDEVLVRYSGDDLDDQTPRFTIKGEPVLVLDYPGDDLDDGLGESDEDLALADPADDSQLVNYSGTGTWHTAGDSLWMEVDEATISFEGTEINLSELPAEMLDQFHAMAALEGEEISAEELADLEKFLPVFPFILKEQLSFVGTYQLEGRNLSLSSLWDSMERIRVYMRPAGATVVAPISWGALKAGW